MTRLMIGLWDGHDAGAAAVDGDSGRVVFAANEERFTRRKLEVGFPRLALAATIEAAGAPESLTISTSDPAKLLSRLFPAAGNSYYRHRRHLSPPDRLSGWKRLFKLAVTQLPPLPGGEALTRWVTARRAGFTRVPVRVIDHHLAHLRAAFFTSGFPAATVMSLDGIGDGCSGAVARGRDNALEVLTRFSGRDSLGLIFEEATRLLNLRELEDEGKVMAMAAHADLDDRSHRALRDLVRVTAGAGRIRIRVAPQPYRALRAALWRLGPERFAAAVQWLAEESVLALVKAARELTGEPRLAVAGGVFANVRINRRIREGFFAAEDGFRVFPHMGDGGLALGAALERPVALMPFLGTTVNADRAREEALMRGLTVRQASIAVAAERIAAGQAIGWITGRMEYGPRALGARSMLARPDDPRIRDKLNLAQKRRVFYQPFCPTLLEEEARISLSGYDGRPERWMTSLYGASTAGEKRLAGVVGPDFSCRPQILPPTPAEPEEILYRELLEAVRAKIGIGGVLNTSFNLHGEPLVRTEGESIVGFTDSGLDALFVDGKLEITRPV